MRALRVVRPGPFTSVQDLGRSGHAHLGVGRSGACDVAAFTLANRLLGNPESAAALEVTFGGLTVRAEAAVWIAVTGAEVPIDVDGAAQAGGAAVFVPAGATVTLGVPNTGLRSYLAVRGGIDVPPVLGSRSTDVLTGLGPAQVSTDHVLPLGPSTEEPLPGLDVPVTAASRADAVHCLPGPRVDWFSDAGLATFVRSSYEVTTESNRVGVRFEGDTIERSRTEELRSEGLVVGAVQVPPSGQPVVFLADHPVTGGYPVIAVVRSASLPVIAQARPGDHLRFVLDPPA